MREYPIVRMQEARSRCKLQEYSAQLTKLNEQIKEIDGRMRKLKRKYEPGKCACSCYAADGISTLCLKQHISSYYFLLCRCSRWGCAARAATVVATTCAPGVSEHIHRTLRSGGSASVPRRRHASAGRAAASVSIRHRQCAAAGNACVPATGHARNCISATGCASTTVGCTIMVVCRRLLFRSPVSMFCDTDRLIQNVQQTFNCDTLSTLVQGNNGTPSAYPSPSSPAVSTEL